MSFDMAFLFWEGYPHSMHLPVVSTPLSQREHPTLL